jgi:UDP-2,3-diacylglucosamine hydrolase
MSRWKPSASSVSSPSLEAGGAAQLASGPHVLPVFYELAVPPEWTSIDFISDLHLARELPRTFEAWEAHLLHTDADAVFMLGDLFEVWVGDDARDRPFERRCVDVLAEAASRRHLAFMAGNRDFLVGTDLLRSAGMMGLPDPTVLVAWGQRVLLTHGDALCLEDEPYQRFRAEVRQDSWRHDFLARPIGERLQFAARVRAESERVKRLSGGQRTEASSDLWADVDATAAVAWLHGAGASEMVHGHTHRPGSSVLAPGYKRHVLSDWDLDHDRPRAEVLRLSRDGFERLQPATARVG